MAKHFIRLDLDSNIIYGFTDEFDKPLESDICIEENGGRHFVLMGIINPPLITIEGYPIYAYRDEQVVQLTEEEMKTSKVAKDRILADLNVKCKARICSTFISNALGTPHLYSYDSEAQINLSTAEQALKYYPDDATMDWRIHDTREVIPHTKEQLIILFKDSVNHLQTCIAQYREAELIIKNATSLEEINNCLSSWS